MLTLTEIRSHLTITFPNLTIETLDKGVKYAQNLWHKNNFNWLWTGKCHMGCNRNRNWEIITVVNSCDWFLTTCYMYLLCYHVKKNFFCIGNMLILMFANSFLCFSFSGSLCFLVDFFNICRFLLSAKFYFAFYVFITAPIVRN